MEFLAGVLRNFTPRWKKTSDVPTTIATIDLVPPSNPTSARRVRSWVLLSTSYFSLTVGSVSATILSRLYFVKGGKSLWVSTLVQTAGFPFLLVPLLIASPRLIPFNLLLLSLILGLFLGANNFLISIGVSYLPISTSSLLLSTQLSFILLFSTLLLRRPIRFTNLNTVILLTLSSILLALNSPSDLPAAISHSQIALGFVTTIGAAIMCACYLPVMEIIYRRVDGFRGVVEMQMMMEVVATAFAIVGGGIKEMWREAKEEVFERYWVTIGGAVVGWQMLFMGTAGLVFLTSSLNSGICMTVMLALNVVSGVLVFGDEFGGVKAVAMVLCLWGFVSYLYGEYREKRKDEEVGERRVVERVDERDYGSGEVG